MRKYFDDLVIMIEFLDVGTITPLPNRCEILSSTAKLRLAYLQNSMYSSSFVCQMFLYANSDRRRINFVNLATPWKLLKISFSWPNRPAHQRKRHQHWPEQFLVRWTHAQSSSRRSCCRCRYIRRRRRYQSGQEILRRIQLQYQDQAKWKHLGVDSLYRYRQGSVLFTKRKLQQTFHKNPVFTGHSWNSQMPNLAVWTLFASLICILY